MEALEFLKIWKRVHDRYKTCSNCLLSCDEWEEEHLSCTEEALRNPEYFIQLVEQWADKQETTEYEKREELKDFCEHEYRCCDCMIDRCLPDHKCEDSSYFDKVNGWELEAYYATMRRYKEGGTDELEDEI